MEGYRSVNQIRAALFANFRKNIVDRTLNSSSFELRCAVHASDPDADPLKIAWDLRKDVSGNKNVGGDREQPTPPIDAALLHAAGNTAEFQLPQQEGPYRIFVYVRDNHGNAATANYPLLVKAP